MAGVRWIFSRTRARTRTRMAVYGAILARTFDGQIVPGGNAGVVLISVAMSDGSDTAFGTLCDDYFNDHSAGIACRSLGFDGVIQWGNVGNNEDFISQSALRENEFYTVVDNMQCPETAMNVTECDADLMDHNCSPYESVWLECAGSSPEPEPEPEWQIMGAGLYRTEGEEIIPGGNAGVLLAVVGMTDDSQDSMGTLCDDHFNNHSAGIACRSLGFDGVIQWGNVGNNEQYISESTLRQHDLYTVMDNMRCPDASNEISECEVDLMDHNCSPYESVWLECVGSSPEPEPEPEPEWQFMGAALFHTDDSGEIVPGGNAGVVLIHVAMSDGSEEAFGTLCDDNFDDRSAGIACRSLGFDGVIQWGNVGNNEQYISTNALREYNLDTVVDQMSCPADARNVTDCEADLMDHDCSHYESVWLECEGSSPEPEPEPEWQFMGAGLYRTDDGEIVEGRNAGVVLVHLATSDGTQVVSGTLCDDGFDNHAARLACQSIGYDDVREWGNVERNGDYISWEDLVHYGLETVVDELSCPADAAHISSCSSQLIQHDCYEGESVWLDCAGGEDGEDGEDEEGSFFELDFKGVKVGLKLGDFRGRIRF